MSSKNRGSAKQEQFSTSTVIVKVLKNADLFDGMEYFFIYFFLLRYTGIFANVIRDHVPQKQLAIGKICLARKWQSPSSSSEFNVTVLL